MTRNAVGAESNGLDFRCDARSASFVTHPVSGRRERCLHWAMESGRDAGVWGSMSEDERARSMTAAQVFSQRSAAPAVRVAGGIKRFGAAVAPPGGALDGAAGPGVRLLR